MKILDYLSNSLHFEKHILTRHYIAQDFVEILLENDLRENGQTKTEHIVLDNNLTLAAIQKCLNKYYNPRNMDNVVKLKYRLIKRR